MPDSSLSTAFAARIVPVLVPRRMPPGPRWPKRWFSGLGALLRLPLYRRIVLVAALILGSHAMHDSFAVIRWRAAGIAPAPPDSYGHCRSRPRSSCSSSLAARCSIVSARRAPRCSPPLQEACAGRSMAETAWLPAMAAIEPLHGLTFALLHLTCLRLLAETVPRHLAATALTIYGTVGIGAPTALLTLASGQLYAHFGRKGSGSWRPCALRHCPSLGRCVSRPANPAHNRYRAAMPALGIMALPRQPSG